MSIQNSLGFSPPDAARRGHVNHGGNVTWRPRYEFQPGTDIDELSRILRWVDKNLPADVKVKAGGSRHSWSPAAATNGVYIRPEKMKFIEALSGLGADCVRRDVSPEMRSNCFRIGAGTTLREINDRLWTKGKSLPALGAYDAEEWNHRRCPIPKGASRVGAASG